jgi:hypothetical protein
MFNKELYEAEELDFFVETLRAGRAALSQLDLQKGQWDLAEKLLGISAIAQPDIDFLVNLENQIHETARKPDATIVLENYNLYTVEHSERSVGRTALFLQSNKTRLLWLPLVASITIILLRLFLAIL